MSRPIRRARSTDCTISSWQAVKKLAIGIPPLLNCYHETLLTHGMSGYDRRKLDEDYRRSVLWRITKPGWQWASGILPII
jgi:hypothetical protein